MQTQNSFDTLASLFVGCLGNGLLVLLSHIVQLWWHRWLWRHRWVLLYVATFQILYDQWSFCSWQGGFWHLHCLGQLILLLSQAILQCLG